MTLVRPAFAATPRESARSGATAYGQDSHLPASLQRRLERLLAGLNDLPSMPRTWRADDLGEPTHDVLKELLGGRCFQYCVMKLSPKDKAVALARLQAQVARERLPVRVVDAGDSINITHLAAHKGNAARDFASRRGLAVGQVHKFGDKACAAGNDRPLLQDRLSFNVGRAPASHPAAVNVAPLGPPGVLQVLRRELAAGRVRAVATDFDGTVGRDGRMDDGAAWLLAKLLCAGTPVAVITGRGQSGIEVTREAMERVGLPRGALCHLSLYLFNGAARALPAEGWRVEGAPSRGTL